MVPILTPLREALPSAQRLRACACSGNIALSHYDLLLLFHCTLNRPLQLTLQRFDCVAPGLRRLSFHVPAVLLSSILLEISLMVKCSLQNCDQRLPETEVATRVGQAEFNIYHNVYVIRPGGERREAIKGHLPLICSRYKAFYEDS